MHQTRRVSQGRHAMASRWRCQRSAVATSGARRPLQGLASFGNLSPERRSGPQDNALGLVNVTEARTWALDVGAYTLGDMTFTTVGNLPRTHELGSGLIRPSNPIASSNASNLVTRVVLPYAEAPSNGQWERREVHCASADRPEQSPKKGASATCF